MIRHRLRCLLLAGPLLAMVVALPGCSKDPAVAAQEMVNKAQAALEKGLDAWTRGVTPAQFAATDLSPRLDEPDWQAGYRLMSFLTSDARLLEGQTGLVHCRVALSLRDQRGQEFDKQVVYQVQLGDTMTITRAPETGAP